jgi:quinol monooxygenase YgiN
MFMLHGRLGAKHGKRDDLLAIMSEAAERMPGCRLYVVAVDDSDPEGVWATEIWESEEAHDASLQLDHVKERISRAMPLVDTSGIRHQRLDARGGIPA